MLSLLQACNHHDLDPAFKTSLKKKPCTLFFPNFGKEVISEEISINKKKLPVKEVVISVSPDKDTYSIAASFNLLKEKNARLFVTTFKTFIIWLMRNAEIGKFTRRITVDTHAQLVRVDVIDFSEEEIIQTMRVLLGEGFPGM